MTKSGLGWKIKLKTDGLMLDMRKSCSPVAFISPQI